MGGASSAAAELFPVRQQLQAYLTFLRGERPEQFEQYFTDLFLSPTSLIWLEPRVHVTQPRGGLYHLHARFTQERDYLKQFLKTHGKEAADVPNNMTLLTNLTRRLQTVRHNLQELVSFYTKWELGTTFDMAIEDYQSWVVSQGKVTDELKTRTEQMQQLLVGTIQYGMLLPLMEALEGVMTQLHACQRAYDDVLQSNFKNVEAVRTLWQTNLFAPLDRSALMDTPFNEPGSVENMVIETVDAFLLGWRKFGDLPYAPPNDEDPRLYLKVFKHLYSMTFQRGSIVSHEISYALVMELKRKMGVFKTVFAPQYGVRSAVIFMTTHGGIFVKSHGASHIKAEKKVVPEGVCLTRVTFAAPGSVAINYVDKYPEFALLIRAAIQSNPDLVNDPMKLVFSLLNKLHKTRAAQNLEPYRFQKNVHTEAEQDKLLFFITSFMRPEAVMYLPGDKYLNKHFIRSPAELAQGYRRLELENPPTGLDYVDVLHSRLEITLDALIHELTHPPYNYNNLILIDQTCNTFKGSGEFSLDLTESMSKKYVKKGLMGGV